MSTVLLTGATGYIGRRLERRQSEREGITLSLLVRNARKLSGRTCQHAQIIEADTFSPEGLRQALTGVDRAVYLIIPWVRARISADLIARVLKIFSPPGGETAGEPRRAGFVSAPNPSASTMYWPISMRPSI